MWIWQFGTMPRADLDGWTWFAALENVLSARRFDCHPTVHAIQGTWLWIRILLDEAVFQLPKPRTERHTEPPDSPDTSEDSIGASTSRATVAAGGSKAGLKVVLGPPLEAFEGTDVSRSGSSTSRTHRQVRRWSALGSVESGMPELSCHGGDAVALAKGGQAENVRWTFPATAANPAV
jgi:hypothetical protein